MAPSIEEWWAEIPPVTKALMIAAIGTTAVVSLGIVHPADLYLDTHAVVRHVQVWRLLTCFSFLGTIGIGWFLQLYIISKYGATLEKEYFRGATSRADFVFMLVFSASVLVLASLVVPGLYFLGPSLVTVLIYVWSRSDPHTPVTFFGFRFQAWQVPFLLMVFHVLMGGSALPDIVGILAGHAYYFSTTVVPRAYGVTLVKTPAFLIGQLAQEGPARAGMSWRRTGQGHRLAD
ncbi:Derlin [Plasmodiophora brassicae]